SPFAGRVATQAYLAFALCVLPPMVPLAIRAVETDLRRRRVLARPGRGRRRPGQRLSGPAAAGPVDVRVHGHHLVYGLDMAHGGLFAAVYALVACGAPLCSSQRNLVRFGVANLVAVAALTWLQSSALTSLWCAWAAVASLVIVAHLRHAHQQGDVRMTIV
ncbi:MAG: hypothetical protein M3066_17160, partial [Actinomycetota bacterium]|nr:hypothetical protein [Actinomycetota bacterium]